MKYLKFLLPVIILVLFVFYSFLPVNIQEKTVEIAYRTPTKDIAFQLYKEGLLRNPMSFLLFMRYTRKNWKQESMSSKVLYIPGIYTKSLVRV